MTQTDRSLQGSFHPITSSLVGGSANTVGTTPIVLFTDLTTPAILRRVRVFNRHATQTLALILVPLGQAVGAQTVDTAGAIEIGPGQTEYPVIQANQRILIVGSGAATTFSAVTHDV